MSDKAWYIVKNENGTCEVVEAAVDTMPATPGWGPFSDRSTAIAKRIGLIRAGKCQPQ
jgi:hypothetical protein